MEWQPNEALWSIPVGHTLDANSESVSSEPDTDCLYARLLLWKPTVETFLVGTRDKKRVFYYTRCKLEALGKITGKEC